MPRSARWPPFPPCPKRSVRKRRKSPSSFIRRTPPQRSEEHTSELQSLMRISYAVFCLKKKTHHQTQQRPHTTSLTHRSPYTNHVSPASTSGQNQRIHNNL